MTDSERPDFETALAELERITNALERDELDLDEALALFEEGIGHLRSARQLLDLAKGRVEELIQASSGELEIVALEPNETGSDDD